jgi:hypothetical protein
MKKLYKFCTLNSICKDNAAIKLIILQHNKRSIPLNFDGAHYAISDIMMIFVVMVVVVDLREIGFGDVDWIHWAQDRDRWRVLVNMVMNLRVP